MNKMLKTVEHINTLRLFINSLSLNGVSTILHDKKDNKKITGSAMRKESELGGSIEYTLR